MRGSFCAAGAPLPGTWVGVAQASLLGVDAKSPGLQGFPSSPRAARGRAASGTHLGVRSRGMPPHDISSAPDQLSSLQREVARLDALARRRGRTLAVTGGALLALGVAAAFGVVEVRRQLTSCRAKLVESRQSQSALASAGETADGFTAAATTVRSQRRSVVAVPAVGGVGA